MRRKRELVFWALAAVATFLLARLADALIEGLPKLLNVSW